MDEFDPIDFFKLFVNDDFLNVIVTETNRYAETRLANDGLPEFSRVKKWRPVDLEEMKVFFGLVIAMGLVQKNDIQDYWSVDETDETPFFSKHMSRDRFLLILSNIHLNNNGNAVPRGQVGFDPLFKLRRRPCRDCRACNPPKNHRDGHKRKQTSYWCADCKKPLCVPECFRVYHTFQNYKAHLLPGQTGNNTQSDSDSDSNSDWSIKAIQHLWFGK